MDLVSWQGAVYYSAHYVKAIYCPRTGILSTSVIAEVLRQDYHHTLLLQLVLFWVGQTICWPEFTHIRTCRSASAGLSPHTSAPIRSWYEADHLDGNDVETIQLLPDFYANPYLQKCFGRATTTLLLQLVPGKGQTNFLKKKNVKAIYCPYSVHRN